MYDFARMADTSGRSGEIWGKAARGNALADIGAQYQSDPGGAVNALLARGWYSEADAMKKRADAARAAEAYKTAAQNAPKGQNPGVTALIGAGQPRQAGTLQNIYTAQTNAANARADRAREAEQRIISELGFIARRTDLTPEQWGQAMDLFKASHPQYAAGIERYRDFNAGLPLLRGRLGIAPPQAKSGPIPVQPGATLYDPASGKAVFTAPARQGELRLPPGVDKRTAGKAIEITDGADNILDTLAVLKDVAGVRQSDGSYKFHPDMAGAVGPQPEVYGYKGLKSMVGITGAAGAAQRLAQVKQTIISQLTSLYNKGQGAISDAERRMYEDLLGKLEYAPDEATFFGLVSQLEQITQSVRDRAAARRPIGLEDRAAQNRQKLGVPLGSEGSLKPLTEDIAEEAAKLIEGGADAADVIGHLKAKGYDVKQLEDAINAR